MEHTVEQLVHERVVVPGVLRLRSLLASSNHFFLARFAHLETAQELCRTIG